MNAQCIGCPYGRASCFTRGPQDAPVVIVGEAPGAMEEAAGEPFVGDSGRLLDGVIGGAGLPIFYTNAMQCRPASHLEPYAEGIAACRPRLMAEIGAHPRKVVIALGNSAVRALFPEETAGITALRGQYLRLPDGTPVVPALHPAAVLRAVGNYRHFARDIKRALEIGGGGEVPSPGVTDYKILDADGVRALARLISRMDRDLVSFDVETSGLNPRTDRVQYLGISVEPHFAYIIPSEHIHLLEEVVQGPQAWVGHNTQFDVKFLRSMGLPIRIDHDTQLMHGCLDEVPGGHGLKTLSNEYLGTNDYESALTAYKKAHGITGDYTQIPADILIPYLAMDADYTLRLARILLPQVEAQPDLRRLYHETLLPATRMLMEVERAGMWMDSERVEIARAKLTIERDNWLATIKEEIEPVWDSDAYRKETGSKAGLKGRTARQSERYSYTSRMKTLWLIRNEFGLPELPNLQQKTLDYVVSQLVPGVTLHGFLTVYLAQKASAEAIKALKDDDSIPQAEAYAVYDARDRAQKAMDSWERRYWNPAAYLAAGQRKEDIPFSPGSHKQVLWVCKRFAIPVSDTQEGTLKGYAKTIPFVEALFGYRGAVKALGTYVDAISEIVSKEADGRVHATYRTTGTVTGRLSSAEPNLQNIPRDPMLRGMFGAPPGRILVEADLSQAELRTLAHFSGDEFLKGVYEAGRDLHSEMAAAIFGPGYTKEQRTGAKTINFGIAYGLSAHGLSHQLAISVEAAQGMIDGWYARLPRAKAYLEACRAAPLAGRILATPFGRRRRYGLITEENRDAVQREATNYAIQSTASDIALHAGIEAQPKLPALDSFIVNIVHDSIIAECPDDGVTPQKVARLLVEIMRRIPAERIGFRVPMDADAKIGRHWGSMQDWKEN